MAVWFLAETVYCRWIAAATPETRPTGTQSSHPPPQSPEGEPRFEGRFAEVEESQAWTDLVSRL
jgi:hypothetical protein